MFSDPKHFNVNSNIIPHFDRQFSQFDSYPHKTLLRTRISVADVPCFLFDTQTSRLVTFSLACSKLPPHGIIDMLGNLRNVAVRLPQAPPLNLKVVRALVYQPFLKVCSRTHQLNNQLVFPGLQSPTRNQEEWRQKVHRMQKIQVLELHPSSP